MCPCGKRLCPEWNNPYRCSGKRLAVSGASRFQWDSRWSPPCYTHILYHVVHDLEETSRLQLFLTTTHYKRTLSRSDMTCPPSLTSQATTMANKRQGQICGFGPTSDGWCHGRQAFAQDAKKMVPGKLLMAKKAIQHYKCCRQQCWQVCIHSKALISQ